MADTSIAPIVISADFDGLTPQFLKEALGAVHPRLRATDFELVERKALWRAHGFELRPAKLRLDYAPGAPDDLPRQAPFKMKRISDEILGEFYESEVDLYVHLLPFDSHLVISGDK